jgi:hypothetical protein
MLEANRLQLEAGGVTVLDSTTNFNTGTFTRSSPVLLSLVPLSQGFSGSRLTNKSSVSLNDRLATITHPTCLYVFPN